MEYGLLRNEANTPMITFIFVSLLFVLVFAAVVVGLLMTWALSGSGHEADDSVDTQAKPRGLKSRLRRFWSWANAVPPKLEYRRDKKGRFRKLKRW